MPVIRISKVIMVAAIGLYASLVAFGNITDYGSNFAFVQHVLAMDTSFPDATIGYRAITNEIAHHVAYVLIIAAEVAPAVACWVGAAHMYGRRNAAAREFNRSRAGPLPG